MGLGTALVDKARVRRNAVSGPRVEGTTQYAPTFSEWFRCRLMLDSGNESNAAADAHRTTRQAKLMYALRDVTGEPFEVRATDIIEVDSGELGEMTFEVTSLPKPIRKKRRVIGWTVPVAKADDQHAEVY